MGHSLASSYILHYSWERKMSLSSSRQAMRTVRMQSCIDRSVRGISQRGQQRMCCGGYIMRPKPPPTPLFYAMGMLAYYTHYFGRQNHTWQKNDRPTKERRAFLHIFCCFFGRILSYFHHASANTRGWVRNVADEHRSETRRVHFHYCCAYATVVTASMAKPERPTRENHFCFLCRPFAENAFAVQEHGSSGRQRTPGTFAHK